MNELGAGRNSAFATAADEMGQRRCLLILGMHRSGTSALTRVLSLAGAKLPSRLMGAGEGNPSGHWEPEALVAYGDRLLAAAGSSWRDWSELDLSALGPGSRADIKNDLREIVDCDYGDAALPIIKDPRLCRFAGLVMEALESGGFEPAPILMVRNPLEVVESLEARDGMGRADAALLWLRHVLDAEAATRKKQRAISTYNALMLNWAGELERISRALSLMFPYSPDEIASLVEEFLTKDLRHHTCDIQSVVLDPVLKGWVSETYEAICVLSNAHQSQQALVTLDQIRGAFNAACPHLRQLTSSASLAASARAEAEILQLRGDLADAEERATRNVAQQSIILEAFNEFRKPFPQHAEATQGVTDYADLTSDPLDSSETLRGVVSDVFSRIEGLSSELDSVRAELSSLRAEYARAVEAHIEFTGSQRVDDQRIALLAEQIDRSEAALLELSSNAKEMAQLRDADAKQIQQLEERLNHYKRETEEAAAQIHRAYQSSTSWKLTGPLRGLKHAQLGFGRLARIVPAAVRHGGGVVPAARKAMRIYRTEGMSGIQDRLFLVRYTSGVDSADTYRAARLRPSMKTSVSVGLASSSEDLHRAHSKMEPVGGIGEGQNTITTAMAQMRLDTLEKLKPLAAHSAEWVGSRSTTLLSREEFRRALTDRLDVSREGLVLSVTHDNYTKIVGGIQICVQVEEQAFRDSGFTYLCLHPQQPLPELSSIVDLSTFVFRTVLDGQDLGSVTAQTLIDVLTGLRSDVRARCLAVHSLLGHAPEIIGLLVRSASFEHSIFWVHDFFSICPNYTLLRNRIAFCGAPPIGSNSCEICVFGTERSRHMARMNKLFAAVNFEIISPSQSALEFWRSAASVSYQSHRVVPHLELSETGVLEPRGPNDIGEPIRIAFMGFPGAHKGWPLFARLAAELKRGRRYKFFHLGVDRQSATNVSFIRVETKRDDPDAMIRAMQEHRIDVAFLWSTWFETYSFTAHEAICSGAFIVTGAQSGNISVLAGRFNAGRVFESEAQLFAALTGGELEKLVMERRAGEVPIYAKNFGMMSRHAVQ